MDGDFNGVRSINICECVVGADIDLNESRLLH